MPHSEEFRPDVNLKRLLQEWKLEQHYEHFVMQHVNTYILKIMKPHHIEKLFQNLPVGDLVNFEQKLEQWKFKLLMGSTEQHLEQNIENGTREKDIEKPLQNCSTAEKNNMPALQAGLPQWEHFEQRRNSSAGQSPIREQFAQPKILQEEFMLFENTPVKIKEEPREPTAKVTQNSKSSNEANTAHIVMPDNLNFSENCDATAESTLIVNAAESDSNSYEPNLNHFVVQKVLSNPKFCSIPKASIRINNTSGALSMTSPINNSASSVDAAESLSSDDEQLSLLYEKNKAIAREQLAFIELAGKRTSQTYATQHTPHMQFQTAKYKQAIRTVQPRYDLGQILHDSSGGQLILDYYEKNQILREEHRTALINLIARYIDSNGCVLSLSESNQLEAQITEIFPSEKEEFYRSGKRGRLYNKVANMRRLYKKLKDPYDTANSEAAVQSPGPSAAKGKS